MADQKIKGVRAAWADAKASLARAAEVFDPEPMEERDGIAPGQWPGYPHEKLPPNCPVTPLGVSEKTAFFIDGMGQLIAVDSSEWGKKILVNLFALTPNYIYWAWPRFSAPKTDKQGKVTVASAINGCEVDDAVACLVKAAAKRGLFDPSEHIRGRGGWQDKHGRFIWHSGESLWIVEKGKLRCSPPSEIDGIFYPRRPPVIEPWQEPVDAETSPAQSIFAALNTWTWERPAIDPVIAIGAIGVMFLSGALKYRPHTAAMGDKSVGKSELQGLFKAVVASALHDTGNTSAAGVYQRMKRDCLPVAVDEFEASEDNRRAKELIEIARVSFSGGRMFRGGQDHNGVEFTLRSAFFMSGINLPPMKPQDRSRFAILNLGKIDADRIGDPPVINAEKDGRMILRALMDAWPRFDETLDFWAQTLREAGLDGRGARDVFGTLFTVAQLLLGKETLAEAGLPIDQPQYLAHLLGEATAAERSEQVDNWQGCLERILASPIDAWKSGDKLTVGGVIAELEAGKDLEIKWARERLAAAGLGLKDRTALKDARGDPYAAQGYVLCVPAKGPLLMKLMADTVWREGGWHGALKQAPHQVVIRHLGNGQNVKINRVNERCLLVDLGAYDALALPADEAIAA